MESKKKLANEKLLIIRVNKLNNDIDNGFEEKKRANNRHGISATLE